MLVEANSQSVEEARNSISPGASRKEQHCQHLGFRFLSFRTVEESICVALNQVIVYSSERKLMQPIT